MCNNLILKKLKNAIGEPIRIGVKDTVHIGNIFFHYGRILEVKDNGDIVMSTRNGIVYVATEDFRELKTIGHLNYEEDGGE